MNCKQSKNLLNRFFGSGFVWGGCFSEVAGFVFAVYRSAEGSWKMRVGGGEMWFSGSENCFSGLFRGWILTEGGFMERH